MSMSTGQSGYASQTYGAPAQPMTPAEQPAQSPHAAPEIAAPSIGRRVGAYAIDAAILGVIGVVALVIVVLVVQGELVAALTEPRPIALWTIPVLMIPGVVGLAIALAYSAMQGAGGSVGQRAVGIRLVHADTGAPLGFWRAVWRNIVWGAACAIIVGYFTPLFGAAPQRRGWHDLASGAVMTERGAAGAAPTAAPAVEAADRPGKSEPPHDHRAAPDVPADAFASPVAAAPADPFASPQHPAPIDPFAVPAPPVPPMPAAPAVPTPPAAPAPERASASDHGDPIAFVPGVTGERDEQPQVDQAEPVVPPVPRVEAPPAGPAEPAPVLPAPPVPEPSSAPAAPQPFPDAPSAPAPAPVSDVPPAPAAPAADVAPATSAPAPAPAAPAPAPAPAAPAPAAPEFPDDTIVLNHAPAPTEVPAVVLLWDDGTRTAVTSRTVFGRNPVATSGADTVAVADETLSLSKTHFEIAIDEEAASIVDLHSTNGVVIVRGGTSTTLVPDRAAPLVAGDQVTIGERTVSIERAGER